MQKEAAKVTCLDQVNLITQPKLELECNQDIDYGEIDISPTNPITSILIVFYLGKGEKDIIVYLKWPYNLLEGLE